ncbi:MAG: hypothetical protein H0X47_22350 [Nitrospirales bacterium]|nr:hypothetical protein [Nitrospirales bacterium]
MSGFGEKMKQRKILIENETKEEKDPAYHENLAGWDVTLEDRPMAEQRLKNPVKRLSSQEMRQELGLEN